MPKIELIQGDCLEKMKDIPDKSIDMVLCDLPYNTTACHWDKLIPFEPLWALYKRIIKDNGAIVLTASQPFTSALVMSNIKMFKYEWVWVKEKGTGFAFSKKQPLRRKEDVLVFYKNQPHYDFQGEKLDKPYKHTLPINKSDSGGITTNNLNSDGSRQYAEYTHKTKDNIIILPRDNANKGLHPTQKPVALFEYLIKTYTNEGDLVLDNCIGSGTTAVACVNTKRNFIGMELSPEYCKIANNRLSQLNSEVGIPPKSKVLGILPNFI